jgi:hypothetical protein
MLETTRTGLIAALAAMTVVVGGCDPFTSENKAAPVIQRVDAIDATFSASIDPVEVTTPNADGSWTVSLSLAHFNGNDDPSTPAVEGPFAVALVIQTNQLLKGELFDSGDCTPVPGSLTVTPAPDSGFAWYTCYNPTSATAGEGASVVVFESNDPSDPIGSATLPVGTVHVTGDVQSRAGGVLALNVSAVVTP